MARVKGGVKVIVESPGAKWVRVRADYQRERWSTIYRSGVQYRWMQHHIEGVEYHREIGGGVQKGEV